MITDYELVYNVKEHGCKKSEYMLFDRYSKLISKMYTRLHIRSIRRHTALADYNQEAYFCMLHAIKSVDLDKLYDTKAWKFYTFFFWRLSAYNYTQQDHVEKGRNMIGKEFPLSEFDEEAQETILSQAVSYFTPYEILEQRSCVSNFYKNINKTDVKKVKVFLDHPNTQSIVSEEGVTRQAVNLRLQRLKKLWKMYAKPMVACTN